MSALNAKLAQPLFPLLTATLLAAGCSDQTAPSPAGTPGTSPAQSPADATDRSAGRGQVPNADLGEPPATLLRPAPGDTATSALKPSFLTISADSWNTAFTYALGSVWLPTPAVRCDAPYVGVRPFTLAQTFGASSKYRQYVTGDAWFYRYNGSSWVYQQTVGADVDLGPQTGAYRTGTFPGANIVVAKGGYYHVKLWLTWFIQYPDGRWVQTAQGAYNFDQAGDYGFGASAGPGGFCKT